MRRGGGYEGGGGNGGGRRRVDDQHWVCNCDHDGNIDRNWSGSPGIQWLEWWSTTVQGQTSGRSQRRRWELKAGWWYIHKMYFSHWEPPGVCKRRRSVKIEASMSGENQTREGHSGRPSEKMESLKTGTGAPWERLWSVREHLGLSPNPCGNPTLTLSDAWVLRDIHSKDCRSYLWLSGCTRAIRIPSTYDA